MMVVNPSSVRHTIATTQSELDESNSNSNSNPSPNSNSNTKNSRAPRRKSSVSKQQKKISDNTKSSTAVDEEQSLKMTFAKEPKAPKARRRSSVSSIGSTSSNSPPTSTRSSSSSSKSDEEQSLKMTFAKEPKASKARRRTSIGSASSNSPPTRSRSSKSSVTRSSSSKTYSSSSSNNKLGSKEKKEKKKKKKKSVSCSSLHLRTGDKADTGSTSSHNSTFPLHTTTTTTTTATATTAKKLKRRSSSSTKKTLEAFDSDNDTSTMASNNNTNTNSSPTKKNKKRSEESTTSSKGSGHKGDKPSFEEGDGEAPLSISQSSSRPGTSQTKRRQGGPLSFESIHGKSIHKPNTRRNRGSGSSNSGSAGSAETHESPKQQHLGTLSPSPGGKKKSVLKAKREKQMQLQILKQKQEREEQEQKELKSARQNIPTAPVQMKKEFYIHDVMDIVKIKSAPAINNDNHVGADVNANIDVDECSSQSSSCSIVSDGSYEKGDLLSTSTSSARSVERDFKLLTPDSFHLEENPSFGPDFAIDVEHEHSSPEQWTRKLKTSLDDNGQHRSPSDAPSPTESSGNNKDESFKSTVMEAMASSMFALTEVIEDESSTKTSPLTSPSESMAASGISARSLSKKTTHNMTPTSGKPPLRMVPKRSKSDVTSLRAKLPFQRKTVTRQRSLTFNEKVRVKRVACQAQICEGETSDLWFQPKEYESIKRKTMALIRAVQDDQTGGVTYCTRGLERYFSIDAVQDKRNDAWDTVLDEQEAQRANNERFDSDRVSRAYAECTRLSSQEALERGKTDEDAIARYTKKMRQNLRRTYSMPT